MTEENNKYSKFDRSVSLLSWAYNEEESIENFLEKATKLMAFAVDDYEIVLIDDGSTDNTYAIAKEFQKVNSRLRIFRNDKNLNIGISSQRAIQKSTKEFLFWQTVDWSYDISDLREFLEYLKEYDIVQGVRRNPVDVKIRLLKPAATLLKLFGIKHITRRSDTVPKAIVSLINYIIIRILFKVPLSDFQNVTFYKTEWIKSIKYESSSSFSNPEGIIKSYWLGKSIKEVPIHFISRNEGKAKGTNTRAIINATRDILRLWFKWIVLRQREIRCKGIVSRLETIPWKISATSRKKQKIC